MATLAQIREARDIWAQAATANPRLTPLFERLDREYQQAQTMAESPLAIVARRAADKATLI